MATLYYAHPDFLLHDTGDNHPECADRLNAIEQALEATNFSNLIRVLAPLGTEQQVRLIHSQFHIETVLDAVPEQGHAYLDADTVLHASGHHMCVVKEPLAEARRRILDKTGHDLTVCKRLTPQ